MTSTVDIKDDSRGRPVQKAKVTWSILHNFEAFPRDLENVFLIGLFQDPLRIILAFTSM